MSKGAEEFISLIESKGRRVFVTHELVDLGLDAAVGDVVGLGQPGDRTGAQAGVDRLHLAAAAARLVVAVAQADAPAGLEVDRVGGDLLALVVLGGAGAAIGDGELRRPYPLGRWKLD